MAKQTPLAEPIRIGPGRLSFPNVFEPKVNEDGNSRYEATLLMPPGFDPKPLLEALEKVAVEEFGKRELWPKKMRKPEDVVSVLTAKGKTLAGKELEGYEPGWTPIPAADPKRQPQVVDRDNQIVTDPKEVYGGRWARFLIRPYAYKNKSAGVTFALIGVRLLKHDTAFSGGVDVRAHFADLDDSEDGVDDAI